MTEERILAAIEAEGLSASTQSLTDYYRATAARETEDPAEIAAAAD